MLNKLLIYLLFHLEGRSIHDCESLQCENNIFRIRSSQHDFHEMNCNDEDSSNRLLFADDESILAESSKTNSKQPLQLDYLNGSNNEDSFLSSTLMGDFNLAPASQISYFYLHKTLGLSEETMWKITLERGSILGLTTANLQEKVNLLRSAMDLSNEDIRELLQKQPAVLTFSAQHLAESLRFLIEELGLNHNAKTIQLRSLVLLYPSILTYSIPNLQQKIDFFTHIMGFSIQDTRHLLLATPQFLTLSVDDNLQPKYDFFRQEIHLSNEDIKKMLQKNANIFATYSLQQNITPKLMGLFSKKLLFEPVHFSKLLLSYPQFLDRSLNHYLLPVTQYFLQDLKFSPSEFRTILTQFPKILSYSLVRIKHIAAYLRYEEGFNLVQVKRIFFQAPQIVCLKEEHLKEKINFIRNTLQLGGKAHDEQLRSIIAGMPSMLKCSLDANLVPKTNFLLGAFHNSIDELREAILLQPTLLGYSLEKRIRPRMELLQQNGLEAKKITNAITLREDAFQLWLSSQGMSNEQKAKARLKKKTEVIDQTRGDDYSGHKVSAFGKHIVDDAGRIILWSRPVPKA